MKPKFLLIMTIAVNYLLIFSSAATASPDVNIFYSETDPGNGLWQYDYTFKNTSTDGEYLYKVYLDLAQELTVAGATLPNGWSGTIWEGTNPSAYLDAMSIDTRYDIAADSLLSGFSFTVNSRIETLSYTAEFDDHAGNISAISGATALAPEPVSAILFLSGSAILAGKCYLKKSRRIKPCQEFYQSHPEKS